VRRTLLGLLVLVLGTLAAPVGAAAATPASAGATKTATATATVSGTVSGIDGVLHDDCLSYPYGYRVTASDAGYWALRTTLVGPDGRRAATDYVSKPPATGTSRFGLLCPTDGYGTYTIHAWLEWGTDEAHIDQSTQLADAHFRLRKPRSRTALTVSTRRPAHGQRVAYRLGAAKETAVGYRPAAFAWVHLEQRRHGRWVRIKGGRAMTHSSGRVKVRLRYAGHHQRIRVRAVTERTSTFKRSASPVVRLW
jgi:hypothetical protein